MVRCSVVANYRKIPTYQASVNTNPLTRLVEILFWYIRDGDIFFKKGFVIANSQVFSTRKISDDIGADFSE